MKKARLEDVQEGAITIEPGPLKAGDVIHVTMAGAIESQILTLRAALMVIKELAVPPGRDPMEVLLETQKIAEEALLHKSTAKQDCGS